MCMADCMILIVLIRSIMNMYSVTLHLVAVFRNFLPAAA
jgi:hypothetical protein